MLKKYVRRVLLLAALWWLLVGREGTAWLFGGPVILAVAGWQLDASIGGVAGFRLWRLVFSVPFFVQRSLVGSCDVAWRALHRRLPIDPVVYDYALRLPAGSLASVVFANCISLLPGTLTAAWEDDTLRVHVLTEGPTVMAELRKLEQQIALLFGHSWNDRSEDAVA